MISIYRVQDDEGRGPFRPGFSRRWIDAVGPDLPPSWIEEFGHDLIQREGRRHEHFGSGCMSLDGLRRWFSADEIMRLRLLGYRIVRLDGCRGLAESVYQVVFARSRPFRLDAVEVQERDAARAEPPR